MHDAELEAYQRVKEAKLNKKPPLDTGMVPSAIKQERSEKAIKNAAKRAIKATNRGALNSSNMLYHDDEKYIQQYYRSKFTAKVMAEKNEISIVDELIIDLLSYACIRVFRKSRLESTYDRFMDRTAPQDPVAQILNCIKSLGLKTNLKGNETSKEALSKLLGNDAEEMNTSNETLTFEQWKDAERAKGGMRIERRADTDFAVNSEFYATPGNESNGNNEEDMDDIMPSFKL